jgi:hypothetical protein
MLVRSLDIRLGDRAVRLLLADLQEHATPGMLSEYLYAQCRNELTVVDALIIRPAVDQPVADIQPIVERLAPVFERVPKLPVHLLTSLKFRHNLSGNVHPRAEDVVSEAELSAGVKGADAGGQRDYLPHPVEKLLLHISSHWECSNYAPNTRCLFFLDAPLVRKLSRNSGRNMDDFLDCSERYAIVGPVCAKPRSVQS